MFTFAVARVENISPVGNGVNWCFGGRKGDCWGKGVCTGYTDHVAHFVADDGDDGHVFCNGNLIRETVNQVSCFDDTYAVDVLCQASQSQR